MNSNDKEDDEWTQQELYKNIKRYEKEGIKVVLIDTILKPLENIKTMVYNPFEMKNFPKGSVFVFYCDTGKSTKERLEYFKNRFPDYKCVSLRGGRGYWRPNFRLTDEINESK